MMTKKSLVAVKQVTEEKRHHHFVLTGLGQSSRLPKMLKTLDKNPFNPHQLSYLSITQVCLQNVPERIGKLTNLATLLLNSNEIAKLPSSIGELVKLRVLNCSRNKLTSCPPELNKLCRLEILDLSCNFLVDTWDLTKNTALRTLNLANNKLKTFPKVCSSELANLSKIILHNNEITNIPNNIFQLPSLTILILKSNLLTDLPFELVHCKKLQKLSVQMNKMNDNILDDICSDTTNAKEIFQQLQSNPPCESGNCLFENRKKNSNLSYSCGDPEYMIRHLLKVRERNNTTVIKVTEDVNNVRPFIAACIITDIKFTETSFKKFIQLHNQIQQGICKDKTTASLMTHDMMPIRFGTLTYTALPPKALMIVPFPRKVLHSGEFLFDLLQKDAEYVHKTTKLKSSKYNHLKVLEGKSLFPCLVDTQKSWILSFPPIANSTLTQVSAATETILVEVTSTISESICRNVLEQFLKRLLSSNLTNPTMRETKNQFAMVVEQVKIVDTEGQTKLVFPSREDFKDLEKNSKICVLREYKNAYV